MTTLQIIIAVIGAVIWTVCSVSICLSEEKRMTEEYVKKHPLEYKKTREALKQIDTLITKYQVLELKEGIRMSNNYLRFAEPTKEVLDQVKVGDLIKCNDWVKPLTVRAVSENYFVMSRNHFGQALYSICSKRPADFSRNYIVEGYPTIGMDAWVFGKFDYLNQEDCEQAVKELESGETQTSVRNACMLKVIYIKRAKGEKK